MPWYRMRVGGSLVPVHADFGHGKRARNAPKHCRALRPDGTVCACMAQFECDWPGCDIPLCADCAVQIGPDQHLCSKHYQQPGLDIGESENERQLALV